MRHNRQFKIFIYIIVIFLATFMLCLSVSPLTYVMSGKLIYNTNISASPSNGQVSYHYLEYNPILADIPEKDSYTNSEIIRVIDSFIWNPKRIFNDALYAIILSITIMGLLAYASLSSYRNLNKNISVIALSLGGHAPPNCNSLISQSI